MRSMSGPAYPMFRAALDRGDLNRVESLARAMREDDREIQLGDALRMVLLYNKAGHQKRYDRAWRKWVVRLLQERNLALDELADIVEGLSLLTTDPSGGMVVLQDVCAAKGIR
jgi:hypothetical protein